MTATGLLRELESSSWMVASASDATGAGVTASRRTSAFTVATSARVPRVLHAYSVLITTGDAKRKGKSEGEEGRRRGKGAASPKKQSRSPITPRKQF